MDERMKTNYELGFIMYPKALRGRKPVKLKDHRVAQRFILLKKCIAPQPWAEKICYLIETIGTYTL